MVRNDKQGAKKSKKQDAGKSKTTTITFRESDIAQRWLLTSEGCPTCAQLKRDLKKEIKSGEIKVTDVGDDKGFEMVQELNLTEAPMFIVELKPGFPVKYIIDE
jgi:hypothetical protein